MPVHAGGSLAELVAAAEAACFPASATMQAPLAPATAAPAVPPVPESGAAAVMAQHTLAYIERRIVQYAPYT